MMTWQYFYLYKIIYDFVKETTLSGFKKKTKILFNSVKVLKDFNNTRDPKHGGQKLPLLPGPIKRPVSLRHSYPSERSREVLDFKDLLDLETLVNSPYLLRPVYISTRKKTPFVRIKCNLRVSLGKRFLSNSFSSGR